MKVIFTDEAIENLEQIGDYIARDSPVRAASFVAELYSNALDIGTFPEAYPIVGRYNKFSVRRCIHGNYLIYYRINSNRVEILQITHGATNRSPWRF